VTVKSRRSAPPPKFPGTGHSPRSCLPYFTSEATRTQIGAWRAYTDKVQKLADDTTRIRFEARTAVPGPSSAIQQLDEIAAQMRNRRTAVDEIVESGRALYATLTPEQKLIADRRLSPVVSLLATGVAQAGTLESGSRGARRPNP